MIAVNDGSRDESWQVIQEEAARHPWLVGIDLSRNFGQHNALLCGIRAARHQTIVTLDDDLQNPPEEISRLLDLLANGHDVVYGSPEREQHGFWRDMASQATKLVLGEVLGASTARQVSGFRAFRTRLRAAFDEYSGPWERRRAADLGDTNRAIKSATTPGSTARPATPSGSWRRTRLNMLTGFSTVPIQVASVLGSP